MEEPDFIFENVPMEFSSVFIFIFIFRSFSFFGHL